MLGIGFWELTIIVLMAVFLIKPDEIPKITYMIGKLAGKAKLQYSKIQQEFDNITRDLK